MRKVLIAVMLLGVFAFSACAGSESTAPETGGTPAAATQETASGNNDSNGNEASPALWQDTQGLVIGLEGELTVAGAGRQFNVSDPDLGGAFAYFSEFYPNFRTRIFDRENEGGAIDQLQQLIAAGTPPDVFITASWDIPNVVRLGMALPLDRLLAQFPQYYDTLIPNATELNVVDGNIYGICWQLLPRAWMINVDLFERLGLEIPDSDWTIEDFIRLNNQMVDRPNGISGAQGDFHVITHQFFVAHGVVGSRMEDGIELAAFADDPNAVAAVEAAVRAIYAYDTQFTEEERNSFGPNWNSFWTNGHVGWVPWSLWGQPLNRENNQNYFRWTALPPPKGPTGLRGGNTDSIVMSIFPTSGNVDLAFRYIMASTSQHFVDNAVLENRTMNPIEFNPAGFGPDEIRFPVGLPPLNMRYVTHPDNQAALDGFILAADAMQINPYAVVGIPNNQIVSYVVPGERAPADMLREFDNERNENLRQAAN